MPAHRPRREGEGLSSFSIRSVFPLLQNNQAARHHLLSRPLLLLPPSPPSTVLFLDANTSTTTMCDFTQIEFKCGHVRYTSCGKCEPYRSTGRRCPLRVVQMYAAGRRFEFRQTLTGFGTERSGSMSGAVSINSRRQLKCHV